MCIQKQAIWELFFLFLRTTLGHQLFMIALYNCPSLEPGFSLSLSTYRTSVARTSDNSKTHFVVSPFEFNTSIHNIKISYKKKTGSKLIIQSMQIVVVKSSNYINSNNLEWRSCHNTRYMQNPLVTEEIKTHSRHQEEECSINQFNHHPVFVTVLSQCINF